MNCNRLQHLIRDIFIAIGIICTSLVIISILIFILAIGLLIYYRLFP